MKKIGLLLLSLICLISNSCDDNVDGKATDTIKLSKKDIIFSSKADQQTITTANDFWWIIEISENGERVDFDRSIDPYNYKEFEFDGGWYKIQKKATSLTISVVENTSEKPRSLYIHLQAGNWFGSSINISQNEKNDI